MGHTLRRPLADKYHQERFPVKLKAKTTADSTTGSNNLSSTACRSSTGGHRQIGQQGSGGGDPTFPDDAGILLTHLPGPQEIFRRDENDTQPEDIQRELSRRSSSFSTLISQGLEGSSETKRLDGIHRSQGRILTRTYQKKTPQIPTVFLPPETLPVESTSVRDSSGSMAIHQTHHTNSRMATSKRHQIPRLHGRLLGIEPKQATTTTTVEDDTTTTSTSRMVTKPGKVRTRTNQELTVHRSNLHDGIILSSSTGRQVESNTDEGTGSDRDITITKEVAAAIGSTDVSTGCHTKRTTDAKTITEMVESTHLRETEQRTTVPRGITTVPTLVDKNIQRLTRDLFAAVQSCTPPICRRIQNRMGSTHGDEDNLRAVVRRRTTSTHQLPRITSRNQSDRRMGRSTGRENDYDCHRQHHGGSSYQQTGRNTFSTSPQPNDETISVSRQVEDGNTSTTHPRDNQCDSRCSIQTRPSESHGVETTSRLLQVDLLTAVDTQSGLIRNKIQPSTSGLHITNPRSGSPGRRRPFPKLGRFRRLRIPSSVSTSESSNEDSNGKLQDDTNSTIMAKSPLVPIPHQFSTTESSSTSELEEPSDVTPHQTATSKPGIVRSTRVDAVTHSLKRRGFSDRSAEAVLNVHRPSTRAVYDTRWQYFLKWCVDRKIQPDNIPIPKIADFLIYLRDNRKLKAGSIGGYLSVVATVRNVSTDTRLAAIPELSAIIKGFKQEDQTKKFKPPEWDLGLVLRNLMEHPYEPIEEAPIDALTKKTLFLLSFATAARVSEIHALDFTQVQFDRGDTGAVHLGLLMDFVAKNQRPGQPPRRFTIRSINNILGPEDKEDRTLCPVRALRRYIAVTRYSDRPSNRLFISCRPERTRDITKNTVAFWIRSTILDAYKANNRPPPSSQRPHELRALAATMAMHLNIPVLDIMRGCFWTGESTFSSYYLRDLSVEDIEGIKRLGPLVAAQSIINGPRPPRHR